MLISQQLIDDLLTLSYILCACRVTQFGVARIQFQFLVLHGFKFLSFLKKKYFHAHAQVATPYLKAMTFATWSSKSKVAEPCLTNTASTKRLYCHYSRSKWTPLSFIEIFSLNVSFIRLFLQTVSSCSELTLQPDEQYVRVYQIMEAY